ncbi:MAG: MFS transporter [Bacteroidales bacterium]|nr:MAG: MFS transporter [Bacteroidales bacterium]
MTTRISLQKKERRNPWAWVPSLYFAEGIPYVIVMTVSVIMYKKLGISNTKIALYTSWLYLPWVIKPVWSPVVDILKTKRYWIVIMQLIVGAGLAGVALTIPVSMFFRYTLAFFWLLAFSSATHDIAADGFYMLGLTKHEQAFHVGIRSTFYRFAMLTGQGLLVILAGYLETSTGLPPVDIEVYSKTETKTATRFEPDSIPVPLEMEYQSVAFQNKVINIGTFPMQRNEADSLTNLVKEWNIEQGFYHEEKSRAIEAGGEETWWSRNIAGKLESFLKKHFGSKSVTGREETTGNVAIGYFHLSKAPDNGKEIIVNLGREKGDKSIALVEGYRFVFNEMNWNIPAFFVIQLDPKLDTETSAFFKARSGNIPLAWSVTFIILAGLFLLFFAYHRFILPYPPSDGPAISGEKSRSDFFREFGRTFTSFFRKREIGIILAFLLLYRLGESQLVKLASPFMLDAQEFGGLGLTTGELGLVYGTVGMIALTVGGLLGGFLAARNGLRYWIWWMIIAMNLPNLVYVYLSQAQPESITIIYISVALEQFGYGFGFTAYMLFMIYISEGIHKTAHYAIATGFMALGMMIPGMISGWLQEIIGYSSFFIWVMFCTIPGFLVMIFVRIDPSFGIKKE